MKQWSVGGSRTATVAGLVALLLFVVVSPAVGSMFGQTVQAQHQAVSLVVNGELVTEDTLLHNGTVYVPVREAAQFTDKQISWHGAKRVVHLHDQSQGAEIVLPASVVRPVWERWEYPLGNRVVSGDHRIPVLMYHHLDDNWQSAPGVLISPERFREHLAALRDAGYEGIFFEDLLKAAYGLFRLPEKPVIITFDDGYRSNYLEAFPLLREFGFKATINVVGASRGRTPGSIPHFSWDEAREMVESGLIEIGDHTWDMHDEGLVKARGETLAMFTERVHDDLDRNARTIQQEVGKRPVVFCYPYGRNNLVTRRIVSDAGYLYQLTVRDGVITNRTKRDSIPRITASGDMSGEELIRKMER